MDSSGNPRPRGFRHRKCGDAVALTAFVPVALAQEVRLRALHEGRPVAHLMVDALQHEMDRVTADTEAARHQIAAAAEGLGEEAQ